MTLLKNIDIEEAQKIFKDKNNSFWIRVINCKNNEA